MNIKKRMASFEYHLIEEEKSALTVEKYLRDVRAFGEFLGGKEVNKGEVIAYKKQIAGSYAPASVNSMLVSVNAFLKFIGRGDLCVKLLKIQRQIFANEKKELTTAEYKRLLSAAKHTRIALVIQTICETGIRVSELRYITVKAVHEGKTAVDCKNKTRVIFIPSLLRKALLAYIKKSDLKAGSVFVTGSGKPLDRTNIWRDMKALCKAANVAPEKVFPHNLRHLFARTFYSIERDIVRLSDLLGHTSIDTTRIYTMETGRRHMDCLERIHRRLMT